MLCHQVLKAKKMTIQQVTSWVNVDGSVKLSHTLERNYPVSTISFPSFLFMPG
jgi:hypothetical protein